MKRTGRPDFNLIVPKRWVSTERIRENRFFFLIGPVRGGGDWQHEMCLELAERAPGCTIAVPCRWTSEHALAGHSLSGPANCFDRQLTWERHYIQLALDPDDGLSQACVIAHLAEENTFDPHPGPEPYGMDTRGEIGEIRGRMMHKPNLRFVLGADKNFHGLSQIERNFSQSLNRNFPIYQSIQESARAAAQIAWSA